MKSPGIKPGLMSFKLGETANDRFRRQGIIPAINAAINTNATQIMRTFKDRVSPIGLSPFMHSP